MNPERFTYRVAWSEADGEFVATVGEFPSLSWLDEDRDEALRGLERLVADVVADEHQHVASRRAVARRRRPSWGDEA